MEKLNVQFFKDNDDVIIVFKNCNKNTESFIKSVLSIADEEVTEIPSLAPANEPEIEVPEIVNEAAVAIENTVEPEVKTEEAPVVETPVEEVKAEPVAEPEKVVITCPKCKKEMSITDDDVRCECGYKIGRTYCGKRLTDEEVTTLLVNGKTELLEGFVSAKTGKEFSAYLFMENDKVKYEFPKKK